jgi:hypothetical protein
MFIDPIGQEFHLRALERGGLGHGRIAQLSVKFTNQGCRRLIIDKPECR